MAPSRGLFSKADLAAGNRYAVVDTLDQPLAVAKTFDAETWDEAKSVFRKWQDEQSD